MCAVIPLLLVTYMGREGEVLEVETEDPREGGMQRICRNMR